MDENFQGRTYTIERVSKQKICTLTIKKHSSRCCCYLLLCLLGLSLQQKPSDHLDQYSLGGSTTNDLKDPNSLPPAWMSRPASTRRLCTAGTVSALSHSLEGAAAKSWRFRRSKWHMQREWWSANAETYLSTSSSPCFAQVSQGTDCKDFFTRMGNFPCCCSRK